MTKTSLLQIRIDSDLKRDAEKLFENIGLDTSTAVRLFFRQAVTRKAIPFPLIVTTDRQSNGEKTRAWDDPDSYLNNPVHIGEKFKIHTRDELHER